MTDLLAAAPWQQYAQILEARLADAFIRHAIDNRGLLTSTRQASATAQQLTQSVLAYIAGESEENDVIVEVMALASKGLAIVTGSAMMQALGHGEWLETADSHQLQRLLKFQLLFLEKLAIAHRLIQLRTQEHSQKALQDALHAQIEQQRHLRHAQEAFNETTTRILELNAHLASITDEIHLLDSAVNGICRSLDLADVTFFQLHTPENHWTIRTTTADHLNVTDVVPLHVTQMLNQALHSSGELIQEKSNNQAEKTLSVVLLLRAGDLVLGAMLANSRPLTELEMQEVSLLLRTFAQSLSALWRNLILFEETNQRSLEMEILYGRYIDSIWNTESAYLHARQNREQLQLIRQKAALPHSSHTLPILISDHPIGNVYLPDEAQLTDEQLEFAQVIVREMGNALNNAYLLQTTRSTSNQLNLATEVSRAATTILDRDLLMKEVVELIRARFGFYYVGLFLADEKGETAVLRSGTGEAGRLQLESHHYHTIGGPSMVGTSIAQNEAIVAQDVTKAKAFKYNPLLPNTRSELALPLRSRGQVIGALTVQSTEQAIFTGETVAVLQSLADQLAISIENAGLFAQTQTTLAETSRLYQASRQISEAATSLDVYKVLVEFAQQSEQIDAAQIVIPDPEYPEFLISPVWWSRFPLAAPPRTQFIERSDYLHNYLGHNELLIIADVQAESRLDTAVHEQVDRFGIRTAAFIPLYAENKWVGTLTVYRAEVNPFLPQELQSFRTLADQAAVILANQRLFEEIKQANEQLRQLDQLKTQFLANMSHELRTPLNSIIGFSRVILKGIDGPITSEQEEDLTSIHNNGQHLLSLINEILDMAKIEAGKMSLTFETVDIEPPARTAFTSIRTLLKPNVELIWDVEPDLPSIEADGIRLRQILTNLLSNAAKYTDEGHVRLEINRDGKEHIHIGVHDTGIGIAPEEFSVLFRAFEQVDNSTTRKVGGTGLGLPITKWMVNMHQGDIWVKSVVGKGTSMHIRLPLRLERQTMPEITFTEAQTI